MTFKTLKVRVKDKHSSQLNKMAVSVNFVWNYINELSSRHINDKGKFLSTFEIHKYTVGANKELGLHSGTLHKIAERYVISRRSAKKRKLSWRKSFGNRRSLGWIPVNTNASSFKNGFVYHNGTNFSIWDSYDLSKYKFRSASFNEDSRGRWYFNVMVEENENITIGQDSVGIDLGLKDIAICSTGDRLPAYQWLRKEQEKIGIAQRANKRYRVRSLHAKVSNRRKDALHKFSRGLVNKCGEIYVGNVSSSKLIKTRMAKSVHDAGWSMLKTMLEYKCANAGIVFKVVDERYTTQVCSCCGVISSNSPKGRAGLGIREWECMECGTLHDRDINSAKNILERGRALLVAGIQ